MLAKFQMLFSLLTLFLSGAFAVSNTTFTTVPTVIVTAPASVGTGSAGNTTTVNSTLLVTPTPTAGSTSTPSSVHSGAGSNVGYVNAALAGVVALGAAFVSL